jgi:hypothetical protein
MTAIANSTELQLAMPTRVPYRMLMCGEADAAEMCSLHVGFVLSIANRYMTLITLITHTLQHLLASTTKCFALRNLQCSKSVDEDQSQLWTFVQLQCLYLFDVHQKHQDVGQDIGCLPNVRSAIVCRAEYVYIPTMNTGP